MLRARTLPIILTGLLFTASCDNALRAGLGCETIRNNVQSTSGDTITTTTGLRILEVRAGVGPQAQSCREATVQYTGWVFGGEQFAVPQTVDFIPGMGHYIPGFEQGVVGINTGGLRRVIIPPHLGYGPAARIGINGDTVIPANSTLIFDLELLATN